MENFTKIVEAYNDIIGAIPPEELNENKDPETILLESHGYTIDIVDKEILAEKSWPLFELLYEYIGGFKSYLNFSDMAKSAEFFKFVYDRPLDNQRDFKIENCLAVATFNKKAGLKMTSIAANYVCFPKMYAKAAAVKLQQESIRFSWSEVSGKAESFLIKTCGLKYRIKADVIKQVYPNLIPDQDNYHYERILSSTGEIVKKCAFGTIKI